MDEGVWLINTLATSATPFPAKAVPEPIEQEAGSTKKCSGRYEENKSLFLPQGIAPRFFGRPAVQPIHYTDCAVTFPHFNFVIFSGSAAQRGLLPPRSQGFWITHNDAPQSAGLLWTSDLSVAETYT
jgi:hypothetical protein